LAVAPSASAALRAVCVDGCYFKAGAYTQSNEEQGDTADAYGQVEIHALDLEHN
jgi:poly(beta-D-mannuronate) lyase